MLEITEIPVEGYECVKKAVDRERGLHAYIAVHSTVLGPALGGMRLWPYASEEEALTDVLRLAMGMTYKAACAGLDLGGGKSVILARPEEKSEDLFEAMGEFVDSFGGRYITAEDVNTNPNSIEVVSRKTEHVTGLKDRSGNPSPYTAHGCYLGLKATLGEVFGSEDIQGKTFAIEGAGSVGSIFAKMLVKEGGRIITADIRQESAEKLAQETGGTVVSPDEIRFVDCDVYCPSALGGSLNDQTIPKLQCKAVVGCANNQLLEARHGEMLRDRGILYAPDYVVNAGGLINVYNEYHTTYDEARALAMMEKIYENLKAIYRIAKEDNVSTATAADRFGDWRLEQARAAQAQTS
ncbi:MAG: Glu/Leu/Phe/Val dehydrogenase [Planctomycetota bacterium]|nr:MAG: Glu/Leu/Phe/Val dehydrogenase [Planctomycetota bacterium]